MSSPSSLILKALTPPGVNRRTCERKVPMKVLGFGVSRTGTSSLRDALKILGCHDVYHMTTIMNNDNPPDIDMWVDAFEAKYENKGAPPTKRDWDQLLGTYMAVTDSPSIFFMEELASAYPDAKIILTLRDNPGQWYKSVQNTLVPLTKLMIGGKDTPWYRIYNFFMPVLPSQRLFEKIALHGSVHKFLDFDAAKGAEVYTEHNAKVRKIIAEYPPERSLEFNVKEGWGPLCKHLGCEVPVDEGGKEVPFPRSNDTAEFNRTMRLYGVLRHVFVGINVVCGAVAVGAAGWAYMLYI